MKYTVMGLPGSTGSPLDVPVPPAALDDRLVRLYTRTGDTGKALDAHDDYVFRMENYIRQKQDETLQEMETRFEVQEKEREIERRGYRISLLVVIILLAGLALVLVMERLRKFRRRAAELQRVNDSKQQIIEFLSRDMKNPANAIAGKISALSAEAAALTPDSIRKKCLELAREAETINTGWRNM